MRYGIDSTKKTDRLPVVQQFNRRDCQCHGFIEDYVDHDLIPLDLVEKRQVKFTASMCLVVWLACIVAAVWLVS